MFITHNSNKRFGSRIYLKILKLNKEKENTLIENWAIVLNSHSQKKVFKSPINMLKKILKSASY